MLDLRNVPAVRKLAEDRAREAHNLFARFTWGVEDGWTELDDGAQATLVCVHLALLCDIQRPDSRDAIARLVAEKAPNLQAWEVVAGCETGGDRLAMIYRYCGIVVERWEPDPQPAKALTLIALAVLA